MFRWFDKAGANSNLCFARPGPDILHSARLHFYPHPLIVSIKRPVKG